MRSFLAACSLLLASAAPLLAQVPAGGEFLVNTYTTDVQQRSRVAFQPGGGFVVVWQSYGGDGSGYAVFGQRYAPGGAPLGGEFLVNSVTEDYQSRPAVAADAKGNFVVVWQSFANDGSLYNVAGQLFDAAGAKVGREFQVNTYTFASQYRQSVAMTPEGRFMVVWTSSAPAHQDGNNRAVVGRLFDRAGGPLTSEFIVNSYTTMNQYHPAVATDGNQFLVAWNDDSGQDGDQRGVFAQRFSASGARAGGEFRVNSNTSGTQYLWHGGVAAADGRFVAAIGDTLEGNVTGITVERFDAAGTRVGPAFVANSYVAGVQRLAAVAAGTEASFVVTWESGGQDGNLLGIFGRRFHFDGTPRGAEFQANTYTPGDQQRVAVASDPAGNFVVTWSSFGTQDGSYAAVAARRYGGLLPEALVVDSENNRVFEPGETVSVRPAWRNVNGASQAFAGNLLSFTGNAPATYTIADGAAGYGTVPNGTLAFCSDCYSLGLSVPPSRPVHFDALALEAITPDAQGQQRRWRLHVGDSFNDVPRSSGFYRFIETLLHHGVTGGCGGASYCPASSTTRAQMAVFVLVAREGAGYQPPPCAPPNLFADVPETSVFCPWIEELANRGVVAGCGGGNYCPDDPVTRDQMAVFVLRTLEPTSTPPPCTPPNLFADVPETSVFCRWIEELANREIVTGCGGGNYCPGSPVTREQMGVFIAATFGLTLYGS